MKKELTKTETLALATIFRGVIKTGNNWEYCDLHYPVEAIVNALLSIEGVERPPESDEDQYGEPGFSTNGWQWDWRQKVMHQGKSYTLSGSGYYGGHKFHLSDEQ